MPEILQNGGTVLWLIAALSVVTLALILWKLWRLTTLGAFRTNKHVTQAVAGWQVGNARAIDTLQNRTGLRAQLAHTAMETRLDPALGDQAAREETQIIARNLLSEARTGLRALDLIVTIAPLLGLLGTVLGMIAAFQALQTAGVRADPATLAGGIWEALLTTAAGMGVAIPASLALTWFDSITERLQGQMEDDATRIFARGPGANPKPS
ncbi:MAG TPA: MotA/TolQ/ExbB proton channel family protein [Roseibacterium sp.]|nr:MotA/TolQ/ExbB proton channel family protein [Roseibacterium sp.]